MAATAISTTASGSLATAILASTNVGAYVTLQLQARGIVGGRVVIEGRNDNSNFFRISPRPVDVGERVNVRKQFIDEDGLYEVDVQFVFVRISVERPQSTNITITAYGKDLL